MLAGLYWLRPASVPRWAVVLGLALALGAFAVAAMFESPARAELTKAGAAPDLADRLLSLDGTRRIIPRGQSALLL